MSNRLFATGPMPQYGSQRSQRPQRERSREPESRSKEGLRSTQAPDGEMGAISVWRSYQPMELATQGRYSEVSAARPHHTSTAQIRRDTSKDVKLVTPAPRFSPYRAYSLIRPFAGAPIRRNAASWLLIPLLRAPTDSNKSPDRDDSQ